MRTRIECILDRSRGRILDVGCTGGLQNMELAPRDNYWVHGELVKRFADVWGLDISATKIDAMRGMGFKNLVVGDAQDFLLDASFDTIIAGELIEHLPNPGAFLASCRRHLKPNGRLILTTPNASGLSNVLYAWLKFPRTCSNPEHTMWFCPTTLATLARLQGFTVTEWTLSEDYDSSMGGLYGVGLRIYRWVRFALPKRLRGNAIVMVLEPN